MLRRSSIFDMYTLELATSESGFRMYLDCLASQALTDVAGVDWGVQRLSPSPAVQLREDDKGRIGRGDPAWRIRKPLNSRLLFSRFWLP